MGLNWTPHPNVTLRLEARFDWLRSPFAGGGNGGPFDLLDDPPGRTTQFLFGVDMIVVW